MLDIEQGHVGADVHIHGHVSATLTLGINACTVLLSVIVYL